MPWSCSSVQAPQGGVGTSRAPTMPRQSIDNAFAFSAASSRLAVRYAREQLTMSSSVGSTIFFAFFRRSLATSLTSSVTVCLSNCVLNVSRGIARTFTPSRSSTVSLVLSPWIHSTRVSSNIRLALIIFSPSSTADQASVESTSTLGVREAWSMWPVNAVPTGAKTSTGAVVSWAIFSHPAPAAPCAAASPECRPAIRP